VVAIRARQNKSTPKPPASPIATKGKNGNFIAAVSASCDEPLRTPKKLHSTILNILRKVTAHLAVDQRQTNAHDSIIERLRRTRQQQLERVL
jgi:hypothetical protein